jgi:Reverse transcriptase (RNA-dependent DNA polymerase)
MKTVFYLVVSMIYNHITLTFYGYIMDSNVQNEKTKEVETGLTSNANNNNNDNARTRIIVFKSHDSIVWKKTDFAKSRYMKAKSTKTIESGSASDGNNVPEFVGIPIVPSFTTICQILETKRKRKRKGVRMPHYYYDPHMPHPEQALMYPERIYFDDMYQNNLTQVTRLNKQVRRASRNNCNQIIRDYNKYMRCGCMSCLKKIHAPIISDIRNDLQQAMQHVLLFVSPFSSLLQLQAEVKSLFDPNRISITEYVPIKAKSTFSAMEFLNDNRNLSTQCDRAEVLEYFQEKFRKVEIDVGDTDSLTLRPYTYFDEPFTEVRKVGSDKKKKNKRDWSLPEARIKTELTAVIKSGKKSGNNETPDHTGFTKGLVKSVSKNFGEIEQTLQRIEFLIKTSNYDVLEETLPEDWFTVYNYPKIKKVTGARDDVSNFRLICQHLKIVSMTHTWVANNLQHHLMFNKLWDNELQKAYGEGTLSAIREVMEIQKGSDHDLVFGFLDIKNAYGSINHDFVLKVMREYKVPVWIQNYFRLFYSKLRVKIIGCADQRNQNSDGGSDSTYMTMERGILQGDHFSNIIFVMCMFYIMSNVLAIMRGQDKDDSSSESAKIINTKKKSSKVIKSSKHRQSVKSKRFDSDDGEYELTAFVDDISTFTLNIEDQIRLVVTFVKVCRALKSGLEFNFEKSALMIIDYEKNEESYRQQVLNEYPDGVPIVIDGDIIGTVRINDTGELIRYLGVHIDSNPKSYGMDYATFMTRELTSQFEEAERIMITKWKKKVNGAHHKYGFMVKKIFDYIASRAGWKIDRIVTDWKRKNNIETRLSNVLRHFAHRWNVNIKSVKMKAYCSKTLSLKNAIRTMMIETESKRKAKKATKSIDDTVIEIVKGRIEAIHTLNMSSSTNPYKFADPFAGV